MNIDVMLDVLIRRPAVSAALILVIGLHLLLTTAGLPSFTCPLRSVTGLLCPGCGVSRGIICLVHGDLQEAMAAHPFAPYFLMLGALAGLALVLGRRRRDRLASCLVSLERKTHFNAVVLVAFLVYGLARLFAT